MTVENYEISRLRAFAVISVFLYHLPINLLGAKFLPMGYWGVDVFMVISGYLVGGHIITSISAKSFVFSQFIYRRMRRLVLPTVVVMLVIVPFFFVILNKSDYKQFYDSIFPAMFGYFNIWQAGKMGYFDIDSNMVPLLHMWSLSVEWQFYISFPVLLLVLATDRIKVQTTVLFLCIISILIYTFNTQLSSKPMYFSLLARYWEFIVGALVYLCKKSEQQELKSNAAKIMSWIALVLSVLGVFGGENFGTAAIFIPLAAVMVILYYSNNCKSHQSNCDILVLIGRRSYSIYLWHWPLIVFFNMLPINRIYLTIYVVVLTVVLSEMTYRFVEVPFMKSPGRGMRKTLIYISTSVLALLWVLFAFASLAKHEEYSSVINRGLLGEIIEETKWVYPSPQIRSNEEAANYIIFGDSHGSQLLFSLEKNTLKYGSGVEFLGAGDCLSIPKLEWKIEGKYPNYCTPVEVDNRFETILSRPVSIIVIAFRWSNYLNSDRSKFGLNHNGRLYNRNGDIASDNDVISATKELITRLQSRGHKVVMIYPIPEFDIDPFRTTTTLLRLNGALNTNNSIFGPSVAKSEFLSATSRTRHVLDLIGADQKVVSIHPEDVLCDQSICSSLLGNQLLYRDSHHLAPITGGEILVREILSNINSNWRTLNNLQAPGQK
jgi:peptidoglycan/LPS O-acetylase OafA/YrhL